jgi:hypothetical protein
MFGCRLKAKLSATLNVPPFGLVASLFEVFRRAE